MKDVIARLNERLAYEKFKGWLEVNPVLRPLLTLNQRTYTPAQVALIIDQSTTLPVADTMDEYRSSSKGYRDRPLLYDIAVR